jgi:hypothetical protein
MDRRDVLVIGIAGTLGTRGVAAKETRPLDANWGYVADTVMGGVSRGQVVRQEVDGRMAARLTGTVSTENNGGFIQVATDLGRGGTLDASGWDGLALDVVGNGEEYDLRLRTADLSRPWQSYRAAFRAPGTWGTLRVAFADLRPHRTDRPLDAARITRLGVLAVGREFAADVAVRDLRLWRQ